VVAARTRIRAAYPAHARGVDHQTIGGDVEEAALVTRSVSRHCGLPLKIRTQAWTPVRGDSDRMVREPAHHRRRQGSHGGRCRSRGLEADAFTLSRGRARTSPLLWPQFCGGAPPGPGKPAHRRRPPDRRKAQNRELAWAAPKPSPPGAGRCRDLSGASRAGRPTEQDRGGEHGRRCGS
jgi:hypothetical protein